MPDKHYVGEVGAEITVDCKSNIAGATVKQLKVKKPDNTLAIWNAEIEGTNFLKYISLAEDFSVAGVYRVQAFVDTPDWKGRGETDTFTIYRDFE